MYDARTGTLSFYSDKFSEYALIYDSGNPEQNPATDVPLSDSWYYMLLCLSLIALLIPRKREKQ